MHATSLAVPPARGARVVVTVHDLVWRHVPFTFPRHGLKWHEHALAEALRRRVEFVVLSRPVADELIEAGAEASARHGDRARKRPPSNCGSRRRIASFGQARHIWRFHPLRQHPRTAKEPSRADRGVLEDPRLLTWSLAPVVVGPVGWGPELAASDGVVLVGAVSERELSALYARRNPRCLCTSDRRLRSATARGDASGCACRGEPHAIDGGRCVSSRSHGLRRDSSGAPPCGNRRCVARRAREQRAGSCSGALLEVLRTTARRALVSGETQKGDST